MTETAAPPAQEMPTLGGSSPAENLALLLALTFLHTRYPDSWAALFEQDPPDFGARGAKWLIERIAAAADEASRQCGAHSDVIGVLRGLTPNSVSEVRRTMTQCAAFAPADVQRIVDSYETALSPEAFFTPRAVATLMATALRDSPVESVYDPYVRGGELLTAAVDTAGKSARLRLHGATPKAQALSIAGLNLLARGENVNLRGPFDQAGPEPRTSGTFVLANPPFNIESWPDRDSDADWHPFPAPPARSTFRWLLHCVERLGENGRAAIIMPNSAAASGNRREREIRRCLVALSVVEAVIALPPGLFADTDAATSLWFLRRPRSSDQPILFVDAANRGTYPHGQPILDDGAAADIGRAWQLFLADRDAGQPHRGVPGLSVAVAKEDIQPEHHSLNPAEYLPSQGWQPSTQGDDRRAKLQLPYLRSFDRRRAADIASAALSKPPRGGTVRIGSVCEVKAGYSYSRLPAKKRSSEPGIPIVLPRHLRHGRIVVDEPSTAPPAVAAALHQYQLRAGDILCVRTGALTPPALIGPNETGWLASTNLLRIRVLDPDAIDPYYLYAYLRSSAGTERMKTLARSTAASYVTAENIAGLVIPFPPPDQLRSLAEALRTLDQEVTAAQDLAIEVTKARDAAADLLFARGTQ
ncbi:type I restriction-modification system subunit M/S [Phytohabitans rumicis]|nr:type I restriction-modification system subunit M/S [Phytohabitans rumicis]